MSFPKAHAEEYRMEQSSQPPLLWSISNIPCGRCFLHLYDMAGVYSQCIAYHLISILIPPDGHILEFPQIRVDCFTPPPSPPWLLPDPDDPSKPPRPAPNAQLYLLTHVHSDHLIGLSNEFTGRIVCSPDTKRMLLQLEAEQPRQHLAEGLRETRQCKYAGLRARAIDKGKKTERIVDRIVSTAEDSILTLPGGHTVWSSPRVPAWLRRRALDHGQDHPLRCESLSWVDHVGVSSVNRTSAEP